jgi:hypothetical protein
MRPVVSILLGPEGLWIAISLVVYFVAAGNEPSTPAGNEFLETLWLAIPLAGIPLTFLTAYLPGGGGWWWLLRVVVVSSVGCAGRLVYRGQRGRLSRFPKLRLARRARIQPLNRALAPGAAHDSCCRSRLEKEPGKDEITVPGVSFYGGRENV